MTMDGLKLRSGRCAALEDAADALIFGSLEGVTSRDEKSDVLTPWKIRHRERHEFLTRSGAQVDPSTRRGQFSKSYNAEMPHLNSYDCPTSGYRISNNWDPEAASASTCLSPGMAAVAGVERFDD